MENNFIQIAAPAGHVVAYMIASIFKHIIDGVCSCISAMYLKRQLSLACRRKTYL